MRDADTTIYLFGTFHMLDGRPWFNDEVRAAFDRSSKVYFEIVKPENPAAVAPLVQKYAVATDGKTLSFSSNRRDVVKATVAIWKQEHWATGGASWPGSPD